MASAMVISGWAAERTGVAAPTSRVSPATTAAAMTSAPFVIYAVALVIAAAVVIDDEGRAQAQSGQCRAHERADDVSDEEPRAVGGRGPPAPLDGGEGDDEARRRNGTSWSR